jgi:hypothetical protein
MAINPPTEDDRNAHLQALQDAVDDWAETETTRLDNEVTFLRAVLDGRNASDLGTKNLAQTSDLLQSEINDFLRVGE